MNSRAFYKSKAFWGCVVAIVGVVGNMFTEGVNAGNVISLASAAFALYGRIVATAPLSMRDQSEADVEAARKDVRTSNKNIDADHGN